MSSGCFFHKCVFYCLFSSISQFAAGGNGRVVVERGFQAIQVSRCAEFLPQRVSGPAHRPGATCGSKLVSVSEGNICQYSVIKHLYDLLII